MKPKFRLFTRTGKPADSTLLDSSPLKVAVLLLIGGGSSFAATIPWNSGVTGLVGDFDVPANWTGGVVPGASDIAAINNGGATLGASTVNFTPAMNVTLSALDLGADNVTNNRPVFNQTGGDLSVGTLHLGHANYGASKSPEYRMSGGNLNISSGWTFGNGTEIKFLASGGTVNYSGTNNWITGTNGVTHQITLTNNAVINFLPQREIVLGGGGNSAGSSQLSLSDSSSFIANAVTTILMGNDGTRGNTLTLAGGATFSAPLATLAMAQWNNGSGTLPATAAGTVTLGDTSLLNVNIVKTGGNNSGNPQWGVLNLNGGTLETSSVQIGASSTVADSTHNVVNANGGTIRAKVDSTNFFQSVYLNIQSGGLVFDTNSCAVTVTNPLTGTGGLTKKGAGTLFASSSVLTYTGETSVEEGELDLALATFPDDAKVSISNGARIILGSGLEDGIGTLVIGGVVQPNGIYGSSSSAAPLENQNDDYFGGTGTFRVGPVVAAPRDLVWEGLLGTSWIANEFETNFLLGSTPTDFRAYDHVTFNDLPDPVQRTVYLYGALQPSSITFNNSVGNDYVLDGNGGSIGGTTGIIKNGEGAVTLGGTGNTYSGSVVIHSGKVTMGSNSAFGNSSGIIIDAGAQVDINGMIPGAAYTYTVAGNGPGSAAIVNSGQARTGDTGIKNLILSGDVSIGNDGNRFDIGMNGTVAGNGFTLTKVGANYMGFRGDASGTPIQVVVAGGMIWAETSPNAFGGSSGSLTIKSGARAGTYATLSIPTPVTIESGGTLINQGAGTGTWTAPFSVDGNVTIDAGGGPIVLTGAISGMANFVKTGGNPVTLANPTYGGNTTVNTGTLVLQGATLNDGSTVSIANTAKLKLDHGSADTVAKLLINGNEMASGTWGSSTSGATHVDDEHFEGSGLLNVSPPSTSSGFASWAESYSLTGNDALPLADPDHDGINNGIEYILGGDPTVPSQAGLPTGALVGDDFVFTFYRTDSSETADVSLSVEYATNLADFSSVPVGATSSGIVTVQENGSDPDLITVTIPKNGDTAKFARLKVSVTSN